MECDEEQIRTYMYYVCQPSGLGVARISYQLQRLDEGFITATVPDTSYLCGSEVSVQVSVKVCADICSVTAPLPRITRADSAEGFTTGLCTSDCVDSR